LAGGYGTGDGWAWPWGLWWDEGGASDLCRVETRASVGDGRWPVSPAICLHTELHRPRPDARLVVHNHPYHATLLATMGRLPDITHQAACMFDGSMVLVDEYEGQVLDADAGAWLADRVGDADAVVLLSHGVIVIGTSAGGGLGLYLAAQQPGIRALVLYSPAIRLYDDLGYAVDAQQMSKRV